MPTKAAVLVDEPRAQTAELPTPGTLTTSVPALSNSQLTTHNSQPTGWAGVKYWAETAAKFHRAALAAQVMAGFDLLALHKDYRIFNGKRADIKGAASWDSLCEDHAGITHQRASEWMRMATAVRPRLAKLDGHDRLRALLELHPSQWSTDDTSLITTAVRKLTDGYTQVEFMRELGLAKFAQGSKTTGGHHPGEDKEPLTMDQQIAIRTQIATQDAATLRKLFIATQDAWTLLQDAEIEAQISLLDSQSKARKRWLATPKKDRHTELEDIRTLLKVL